MSGSNRRLFLKTIPFVIAVVVGVQPLASQQTEATFADQVTSGIQAILSTPTGQPVIMSANLELAQGAFIASIPTEALLGYVDGLKAAGAQRIEINPGYLSLQDPSVMAKYDQLVQHIRQLGLLLTINTEYITAQQPVTSFQQFQSAAVAGAQQIAARYQPDNFVIVHEPDTMAGRMGISTTVADWDGFIRAVAPGVQQSSPHTRLGAGCYYAPDSGLTATEANNENAYFEDFATIPYLDFLTMDIYNVGTFDQYQQWAQLAHSSGKGVYIEETWIPHYFENGLPPNWASLPDLDQAATIGADDAIFAPLFAPWIQAMALFASANGMEAVTPFTTPAFFQYGTTGSDVPEDLSYDMAVATAIEQGQLTATGQAYQGDGHQVGIKVATSVSSATYATIASAFIPNCGSGSNPCNADATVAPDELVSAFGVNLATSSAPSPSAKFPTTLGGTSVTLVDSSNTSYAVPLSYVSPTQVNYVVPSAAQPGAATLTVTSGDGTITTGVVLVSAINPGLYTANASGKGAPAGFAVCSGACAGWPNRQANGQYVQNLFSCSAGSCTPQPISLGVSTDTVALELFGTGIRHVASASAVTATINGQTLPVQFAGAQGQFTGEDQVNVVLPHSLAGSGTVSLILTATVSASVLPQWDTNTTPTTNTVTIDIE